ncbi:MAG: type V CRISPR-associated protein Cas4 [Dissulfurispiraceae bacterium]|jgi:CRISPR-associated protein Cas4|nr:type V CRISPR-associated protein Cas4 [Dissulfurispiraceae bacterium]
MESYIPISFLNDYIFCPRSIYFHQLYGKLDTQLYQQKPQISGKAAHAAIDGKTYSTRRNILQGVEIYSERYGICGKIDTFDVDIGKLVERKRQIKTIYDGYIFQVYAQYHALVEMGYKVKTIDLYDISHNKSHAVALPESCPEMQQKFEELIDKINRFDMYASDFCPNQSKCSNCIYSNLCDYGL